MYIFTPGSVGVDGVSPPKEPNRLLGEPNLPLGEPSRPLGEPRGLLKLVPLELPWFGMAFWPKEFPDGACNPLVCCEPFCWP